MSGERWEAKVRARGKIRFLGHPVGPWRGEVGFVGVGWQRDLFSHGQITILTSSSSSFFSFPSLQLGFGAAAAAAAAVSARYIHAEPTKSPNNALLPKSQLGGERGQKENILLRFSEIVRGNVFGERGEKKKSLIHIIYTHLAKHALVFENEEKSQTLMLSSSSSSSHLHFNELFFLFEVVVL